jgi:hypothetical protein
MIYRDSIILAEGGRMRLSGKPHDELDHDYGCDEPVG